MFNPLVTDLDKFTEDQLVKKVEKLQNYYFSASSEEIRNQIIDLLEVYKSALQDKQAERYNKDIISGQTSAFDDLINIR